VRGLRLSGVIEVGLSNDVNQILKRLTLVVMATKFETKQAITNSSRIENNAVLLAPSSGYSWVGH